VEESQAQFAIGIFGSWGSGKTTLMHAIERQLDRTRVIPVEFSAWRYEKEEHLIVPLLDTVRQALDDWSSGQPPALGKLAKDTASTVGKVIKCILAGITLKAAMPGAWEVSYAANQSLAAAEGMRRADEDAKVPRSFYHASFQALSDAFKRFIGPTGDRRIVVFIDDLDRCLPEGALEVLESMKLFFDLPGFIFVVGLDRQVIEWFVDYRYQPYRPSPKGQESANGQEETFQIRGSAYINKIFQVPFTLPPVSIDRLGEFLNALYQDANLPPLQVADIQSTVAPHLAYLVTDAGMNPRQVKQYINAYTLQMKVKGYLDANAVLALQTIALRPDWALVNDSILFYHEVFTDGVNQWLQANHAPLEELDSKLRDIPNTFLDYVSPGAPANSLLHIPVLAEYIYSGEATRSTRGPSLFNLIRGVAKLNGLLSVAISSTGAYNAPAVDTLRKELAAAGSLASSQPSLGDPTARALQRLQQAVTSMPETSGAPVTPEEWLAWRKSTEALVRQTLDQLMRVYHSAAIGSATAASA